MKNLIPSSLRQESVENSNFDQIKKISFWNFFNNSLLFLGYSTSFHKNPLISLPYRSPEEAFRLLKGRKISQ